MVRCDGWGRERWYRLLVVSVRCVGGTAVGLVWLGLGCGGRDVVVVGGARILGSKT